VKVCENIADRQTDKRTDKQTDVKPDRRSDRLKDRQIYKFVEKLSNINRKRNTCFSADLPNGKIRLRSGRSPDSGLVERQIHGLWAALCAYGFSSREADVVCRTLNYKGALSFERSWYDVLSAYSPSGDKVYKCKGDESQLGQCEFGIPEESCEAFPPRVTCHNKGKNLECTKQTSRRKKKT